MQEALIYVCATIYFWQISKHWFWLVLIGYIWNVLSIVLLVWLPESPRYLVSRGRLDEARDAFAKIAWWNKCELKWDERLYAKNGRAFKRSAVMCSQDSEGQI